MILIDSSIWIDLLGLSRKDQLSQERLLEVATCPPVIQEVLQGIKNDLAYQRVKESMLALPRFGDPADMDLHLAASDLYRLARKQGITVRSSVDCLIATIALQNGLEVWHSDRDFQELAKITGLKTQTGTTLD
jgi:predicted nucleic acid-binding protein